MSNGHAKQRRGGAPHARHGPQRPERGGSPGANGNGPANGQAAASGAGSVTGAKRPAKANDDRVTLQAHPTPSAKPTGSAAPSANGQPAARQKRVPGERATSAPPARPPLPVVRRRSGPVIVPPTSRAASTDPDATMDHTQAPDDGAAAPHYQPSSAHPDDHTADAFVISLAQRELEVAIEGASVELFALAVERIDTIAEIAEIDEATAAGDLTNTTGEQSASDDPSSGADADDADNPDLADTTPALPVAPTPHKRLGRFYSPGGAMRPDESWVDRAPSAAPNGATDHVAAVGAPPQSHPGGQGTPSTFPIPEHFEHFDHSSRVGPRDDLGRLIDSLHSLFEQDRAVASQTGTARCGVCYLHFPLAELDYRDQEGFYVCAACNRSLGGAHIPMVRRQQR